MPFLGKTNICFSQNWQKVSYMPEQPHVTFASGMR